MSGIVYGKTRTSKTSFGSTCAVAVSACAIVAAVVSFVAVRGANVESARLLTKLSAAGKCPLPWNQICAGPHALLSPPESNSSVVQRRTAMSYG